MGVQDFGQAVRSLRKTPGFTIAAAGSIALGIAGNVAIFSLVNAILIRSLPYPERAAHHHHRDVGKRKQHQPSNGTRSFSSLPLRAICWSAGARTWNASAHQGPREEHGEPRWSGRAGTSRHHSRYSGFPRPAGYPAAMGRWFTPDEEVDGASEVVILGDYLWRHHFSAALVIVGRRILLEGRPHTIIGVAPPSGRLFRGYQVHPLVGLPDRADVLTPIRLRPEELSGSNPLAGSYIVIGRLKRGRTIHRARAEIEASAARIGREHPEKMTLDVDQVVETLQDTLGRSARKPLVVLLGSVGILLLIACVNVANLMLVRSTNRRRELALRTALRATRLRIIAQSLAESILLAVSETAIGILLGSWIMDVTVQRAPFQWARLEDARLDGSVLAFVVGLCFLTTMLFGILPAWRASQVSLRESLQSAGRGKTDGPRGGKLRPVLVSVEVGLSTVLLIGAGLLEYAPSVNVQVRLYYTQELAVTATTVF
jgi:putative ABC transport system permease protein